MLLGLGIKPLLLQLPKTTNMWIAMYMALRNDGQPNGQQERKERPTQNLMDDAPCAPTCPSKRRPQARGSRAADSQPSAPRCPPHQRYKDILASLGLLPNVEVGSLGREPQASTMEADFAWEENRRTYSEWAKWWMQIGSFEASRGIVPAPTYMRRLLNWGQLNTDLRWRGHT